MRHQLLLRYYELLLSLDVLAQAAEVKTLMGYINTLERYAKRFENKPSKKEAGKKGRKNTADETTAAPTEDEADRVLALDWHNFARQQSETLHRLLHAKEELQKRLSRLECELNDILHAVELMELSETKEWELFSRLKENRCARRACKDTLLLLDTMGNATGCELADGRLTRLTDTLSNRTYTPRICKTLFSTEQKPRETELLKFYDFGTTFKED